MNKSRTSMKAWWDKRRELHTTVMVGRDMLARHNIKSSTGSGKHEAFWHISLQLCLLNLQTPHLPWRVNGFSKTCRQ